MDSFWTQNWWAIPLWLLGVVAMVVLGFRARRNPDETSSRWLFRLFPLLDPEPRQSAVRPFFYGLVLVVIVVLMAY